MTWPGVRTSAVRPSMQKGPARGPFGIDMARPKRLLGPLALAPPGPPSLRCGVQPGCAGLSNRCMKLSGVRISAVRPSMRKGPARGPFCIDMARPERFELPTAWFVARYSIQLSYGRGSLTTARARIMRSRCAPCQGTNGRSEWDYPGLQPSTLRGRHRFAAACNTASPCCRTRLAIEGSNPASTSLRYKFGAMGPQFSW